MFIIMSDRVAGLIPSARPKPADPTVTPTAVARFSAAQRPAYQIQAASQLDLIDAELQRPRQVLSVEDQGDRETLLAQYAAANKTLSGVALRQSTAVLS